LTHFAAIKGSESLTHLEDKDSDPMRQEDKDSDPMRQEDKDSDPMRHARSDSTNLTTQTRCQSL